MEITEIKQQLNILTVLDRYGIKPNRNNMIKCPFHEDDKASLQIYPETNTWYCFGCGKGRDTIDLIKYIENCTIHEAILKAATLITQYSPLNTNIMKQEIITNTLTKEQRIQGLTSGFKYFGQSLKTTVKAQQYLKNRSIDYTKIIAGYDSHNFHKAMEVTKELQQLYLDLGLIFPDKHGRKDNYHSRFNGCIVFPTFDEQGNIVSMYGRKTEVKEREGGHYKLPGDHRGLYPKYPDPNTEILLITECIIDTATLIQHEFITEKYTLLSLYGAKIWTEEHSKAIRNLHQLKEIIFALDGDKEGREGIQKHAETVKQINPKIKISYIEIPEGEDINSIAQSHENPQVFTEFINNRKPINNINHFFLSQEKKDGEQPVAVQVSHAGEQAVQEKKENGTLEIKHSEKEKNKVELTEMSVAEPTKTISTNGVQNYHPTGKLKVHNPNNITYETEFLQITLQGGIEFYNLKRLSVTLHIQLKSNIYKDYRDTVDLYSHSRRKRLIQELAESLEVSTTEISQVITDLTNQLEHYRNQKIEQKRKEEQAKLDKNNEKFTQQEMEAGNQLLGSKDLMKKTKEKISSIGLIGQEKNGMLLFFIYLTRMFREPLHALVQGKSGSGKTYLLKKIIGLVPKLHYKNITAITENALYNVFEGLLKNVILLLEDLEGCYAALLPIRELMTNLFINKWTTITNPRTGIPEQKELYVEGPVCIAGATTQDKIYEDNANRSFQIQIEESKEQEGKVLEYQRKEAAGQIDNKIEAGIQTIMKTAQLHLKHVEVIIPFADELNLPEYIFKKQRTNKHYLTLIKVIAFWHQKQRKWKTGRNGNLYIEATLEDVWWANYLCKESLLRKSDELSPQLRIFFEGLKQLIEQRKVKAFYQKEIIQHYRLHPKTIGRYLRELEQRNYLKVISHNRNAGYEYEVVMWDDYKKLQSSMNLLDEIYKKLKDKYEGGAAKKGSGA